MNGTTVQLKPIPVEEPQKVHFHVIPCGEYGRVYKVKVNV